MRERFFHNRTAVMTVLFVLIIAAIGILAPVLAPHDPYETDILNKFAEYSLEYPLGTDHLGRCVLSRLIYGIRPTLGLALLTMLGTIGLGALLGIMAGYFRGVVEEVIMRVVDVMLSFPSQIMVFAVVGLLGISVQNVIIANVFIKWAWYARMIRTGVMQYNTAGKRGVGCGLGNVMKTRDGEPLAGGASAAADFAGVGQTVAAPATPAYGGAMPATPGQMSYPNTGYAAPAPAPAADGVAPWGAADGPHGQPQQGNPMGVQPGAINPLTGQPYFG